MPGLVPGIHVCADFQQELTFSQEDVDGRDKPGHDEGFHINWIFRPASQDKARDL